MVFGFFRKHQKWIFGVIASVIVLSFSFTGTYSALMSPKQGGEAVGKVLPDGTRVTAREWQAMVGFLRSSRPTAQLARDPLQANLLNDGVIEQDLLATGLAAQIGMSLGESAAAELAQQESHERLKPLYVHAESPNISQQRLWEQLAPPMAMAWNGWVSMQGAAIDARWQQRAELFLAQLRIPPEWTRKFLLTQEKAANMTPDARLAHGDLALFGYHTLDDWFGKSFVEQAAAWILHGSMYAEQLGLHVGLEEARADLAKQGQEAYRLMRKDPRLENVDFQTFYGYMVGHWAGDEELATRLWQRVLLMRKLLSSQSAVALQAALPFEQFGQFATRTSKLKRFEMAPEWNAQSSVDKGRMQQYVKLLGPSKEIPDVAEGVATYPHLVARRCQVEVSTVSQRELEAQVPLQQVRAWSQEHAAQIAQQFADPHAERREVDQYARKQLVAEHPEWLSERLAKTKPQTSDLLVSYADLPCSLSAVSSKQLRQLMDGEPEMRIQEGSDTVVLHLVKAGEPQWLTFREAKELGAFSKEMKSEEHPLQEWVAQARAALERGAEESEWVQSAQGNPLVEQFRLVAREENVDRNNPLAKLQAGEWTQLNELAFCHCVAIEEGTSLDRSTAEQQLIQQTARREMAQQLAAAASSGCATLWR